YGAIPVAPQSAFAEFAHMGPLARSVADCEIALAVLGQPDARDAASLYPRSAPVNPDKLRIGWTLSLGPATSVQPAIEKAMREQVAALAVQGHALREISLPEPQ